MLLRNAFFLPKVQQRGKIKWVTMWAIVVLSTKHLICIEIQALYIKAIGVKQHFVPRGYGKVSDVAGS